MRPASLIRGIEPVISRPPVMGTGGPSRHKPRTAGEPRLPPEGRASPPGRRCPSSNSPMLSDLASVGVPGGASPASRLVHAERRACGEVRWFPQEHRTGLCGVQVEDDQRLCGRRDPPAGTCQGCRDRHDRLRHDAGDAAGDAQATSNDRTRRDRPREASAPSRRSPREVQKGRYRRGHQSAANPGGVVRPRCGSLTPACSSTPLRGPILPAVHRARAANWRGYFSGARRDPRPPLLHSQARRAGGDPAGPCALSRPSVVRQSFVVLTDLAHVPFGPVMREPACRERWMPMP